MSLSSYITFLLIVLAALGGWYALDRYEDNVVINILASREEELALPVYAQFIVTQKVTLPEKTTVTNLVVPVYYSAGGYELQIDLLKGGELVQRWRRGTQNEEMVDLDLLLGPPYMLGGEVEVQFSAVDIGHEEAEYAPRIFVEKDDGQYPEGNYRVAENEKQGDISLKVVERRRVLDKYILSWQKRPLKLVYEMGRWSVLALLLVSLPGVLVRLGRGGSAEKVVKKSTQRQV